MFLTLLTNLSFASTLLAYKDAVGWKKEGCGGTILSVGNSFGLVAAGLIVAGLINELIYGKLEGKEEE